MLVKPLDPTQDAVDIVKDPAVSIWSTHRGTSHVDSNAKGGGQLRVLMMIAVPAARSSGSGFIALPVITIGKRATAVD